MNEVLSHRQDHYLEGEPIALLSAVEFCIDNADYNTYLRVPQQISRQVRAYAEQCAADAGLGMDPVAPSEPVATLAPPPPAVDSITAGLSKASLQYISSFRRVIDAHGGFTSPWKNSSLAWFSDMKMAIATLGLLPPSMRRTWKT